MNYCVFLPLFFTAYGNQFLDPSEWENTPQDCGKTRFRDKEPRSTSREKAATGQFPWVARIGYYSYKEKSEIPEKKPDKSVNTQRPSYAGSKRAGVKNADVRFTCGGSLVSSHYILSAAQCGLSAQVVRVGENNLESEIDCDECDDECAPPHQDIGISRRLTAKECAINRTNDVCILELKKSAELNDFVQPICIPRKPKGRILGFLAAASVIGWATLLAASRRTAEAEPVTGMMFTSPPIMTTADCNKLFVRNLQESQMCIGYSKNPRVGCLGDFGGGLVGQSKVGEHEISFLGGVATHSLSDCFEDKITPVIYTQISKVADWIEDTIKAAVTTRKPDITHEEETTTEYETTTTENPDDEIEDTTLAEDETELVSNDTVARTNVTDDN